MKWRLVFALLAAAIAAPAQAEKLEFDHRSYPPLVALLDSGRTDMIAYDDSNPAYITDRIAIQGASVENWIEALDIIVRRPNRQMRTAAHWANEIRRRASAVCHSTFTTIAEDANTITFERQSTDCPAGVARTGLYRIVAGRRSLFLLNAFTRDTMAEPMRQQWLALLATAHLN